MTKAITPAPAVFELAAVRKAIKLLAASVERRNTIPILTNLALRCGGGELTIGATDLDISLEWSHPVEGEVALATTVSARPLAELLAAFDGEHFSLTDQPDKGRLLIEGDDATARLATLPIADFPTFAPLAGPWIDLNAKRLDSDLAFVQPAISTEETRFYLNGAFFTTRNGRGELVATDGHRLHAAAAAEGGDWPAVPFILPTKAVKLIRALIAICPGEEFVQLAASASAIAVHVGPWRLRAKLIDATYPDYSRIIPTSNGIKVTAAAPEILAATARVAAICEERIKTIGVNAVDGGITVRVRSPDNGDAEAKVRGAAAPAFEFTIGFNRDYMAEILRLYGKADVEVTMYNAAGPTTWTSPSAAGRLAVLMPMRV